MQRHPCHLSAQCPLQALEVVLGRQCQQVTTMGACSTHVPRLPCPASLQRRIEAVSPAPCHIASPPSGLLLMWHRRRCQSTSSAELGRPQHPQWRRRRARQITTCRTPVAPPGTGAKALPGRGPHQGRRLKGHSRPGERSLKGRSRLGDPSGSPPACHQCLVMPNRQWTGAACHPPCRPREWTGASPPVQTGASPPTHHWPAAQC